MGERGSGTERSRRAGKVDVGDNDDEAATTAPEQSTSMAAVDVSARVLIELAPSLSAAAAHHLLWRVHGGAREAAAAWLLEHGGEAAELLLQAARSRAESEGDARRRQEEAERRAIGARILAAGHGLRAEADGVVERPSRPVPFHDGRPGKASSAKPGRTSKRKTQPTPMMFRDGMAVSAKDVQGGYLVEKVR